MNSFHRQSQAYRPQLNVIWLLFLLIRRFDFQFRQFSADELQKKRKRSIVEREVKRKTKLTTSWCRSIGVKFCHEKCIDKCGFAQSVFTWIKIEDRWKWKKNLSRNFSFYRRPSRWIRNLVLMFYDEFDRVMSKIRLFPEITKVLNRMTNVLESEEFVLSIHRETMMNSFFSINQRMDLKLKLMLESMSTKNSFRSQRFFSLSSSLFSFDRNVMIDLSRFEMLISNERRKNVEALITFTHNKHFGDKTREKRKIESTYIRNRIRWQFGRFSSTKNIRWTMFIWFIRTHRINWSSWKGKKRRDFITHWSIKKVLGYDDQSLFNNRWATEQSTLSWWIKTKRSFVQLKVLILINWVFLQNELVKINTIRSLFLSNWETKQKTIRKEMSLIKKRCIIFQSFRIWCCDSIVRLLRLKTFWRRSTRRKRKFKNGQRIFIFPFAFVDRCWSSWIRICNDTFINVCTWWMCSNFWIETRWNRIVDRSEFSWRKIWTKFMIRHFNLFLFSFGHVEPFFDRISFRGIDGRGGGRGEMCCKLL